jgi:hypothetical protein
MIDYRSHWKPLAALASVLADLVTSGLITGKANEGKDYVGFLTRPCVVVPHEILSVWREGKAYGDD